MKYLSTLTVYLKYLHLSKKNNIHPFTQIRHFTVIIVMQNCVDFSLHYKLRHDIKSNEAYQGTANNFASIKVEADPAPVLVLGTAKKCGAQKVNTQSRKVPGRRCEDCGNPEYHRKKTVEVSTHIREVSQCHYEGLFHVESNHQHFQN